jgi:glutamyl-tRNA synthetase
VDELPKPVGRLAPSPSGRLHLGHARTFVLAWAHLRSRGGRVVLRLEDLDQARCRPEYRESVLRDLSWLGLDWDGPVVTQSERIQELREAADQLWRSGAAYGCVCTRADLKHAASAPQRGSEELRYAGTCRARQSQITSAPGSHAGDVALRFRVPEGQISFEDGIAGLSSYDVGADVGDFVILNRLRVPAYQLAVVVDDAYQGVTEVFRGDDLLSSTPRQLLLQRALGLTSPAWFHVPLVVDESGRRLAKRADDLSLEALREAGVDPRAILSWVAQSAGFSASGRLSSAELCSAFDLGSIDRRPVMVSEHVLSQLLQAD